MAYMCALVFSTVSDSPRVAENSNHKQATDNKRKPSDNPKTLPSSSGMLFYTLAVDLTLQCIIMYYYGILYDNILIILAVTSVSNYRYFT